MAAKSKSSKTSKSTPKESTAKAKQPAAKKTAAAKATSKTPKATKKSVQAPSASKGSTAESGVPKAVKKLTARERDQFKDLLMRLRDRMSGQVASLKGESLTREDSTNNEEDGTDAFERLLGLSLANSESDSLHEIDEAIARINEGVYGICENCGCNVRKARLKALPFVRMCVQCQSDIEKKSGHQHLSTRFL